MERGLLAADTIDRTAPRSSGALSKRHDISRQLIRIWVGKFEAGALDDEALAAASARLGLESPRPNFRSLA